MGVCVIIKYLLVDMIVLPLHLMARGATTNNADVVVVVVALSLVVLHLEQVIVLLLRVAVSVGHHGLPLLLNLLLLLLLLLLDHIETLRLGAGGLERGQLRDGSPHILLMVT